MAHYQLPAEGYSREGVVTGTGRREALAGGGPGQEPLLWVGFSDCRKGASRVDTLCSFSLFWSVRASRQLALLEARGQGTY